MNFDLLLDRSLALAIPRQLRGSVLPAGNISIYYCNVLFKLYLQRRVKSARDSARTNRAIVLWQGSAEHKVERVRKPDTDFARDLQSGIVLVREATDVREQTGSIKTNLYDRVG